jgi:hypothetical protein
MKKKLFILTMLAGFLTVSCTRDWKCECNSNEYTYKDMKRSEAKEACEKWSEIPGVDCSLKLL